MAGASFSDDEWQRIWACLKDHPGSYVAQEAPTRAFVEAVLWMARAGAAWRLLPTELGPWNSVYERFAPLAAELGQETGVWQMLMDRLSADGDGEWLMLDSTVVRAHACAAGAKKAKGSSASDAHGVASPASCTVSPTASATRSTSGRPRGRPATRPRPSRCSPRSP
jgi:transposase